VFKKYKYLKATSWSKYCVKSLFRKCERTVTYNIKRLRYVFWTGSQIAIRGMKEKFNIFRHFLGKQVIRM